MIFRANLVARLALMVIMLSSFSSQSWMKVPRFIRQTNRNVANSPRHEEYSYDTNYFTVPVDHFGYSNQDTFKMRYLVNAEDWKQGGPIFFYTGNEGDITMFCNNTGFMWDIAQEFGAMLVFAEHRYYGTTMPYGDLSYKNSTYLGYLTSEQALADFADLVTMLKSTVAVNSPIILFGGSYGGMLAAWMRMKYPFLVDGALAASAPIFAFGNLTRCDYYVDITTRDFSREGAVCADNIRNSWAELDSMAKKAGGLGIIVSALGICEKNSTISDIKSWLYGTWQNVVMVNYPYAASFLEDLPAWPVKHICKHLNKPSLHGKRLLEKLRLAVGVYYNTTGRKKCYKTSSTSTPSLGDLGWGFQACSEMVMPMCSKANSSSMFEPSEWNLKDFAKDCQKQWGVKLRANWAQTVYGGKNLKSASNIIFSNGILDPWSGAGVLEDPGVKSLFVIKIAEGAHHLDLRGSNKDDPNSVIEARKLERRIIKHWINQKKARIDLSDQLFVAPHTRSLIVVLFSVMGIILLLLGYLTLRRQGKTKYPIPSASQKRRGSCSSQDSLMVNA